MKMSYNDELNISGYKRHHETLPYIIPPMISRIFLIAHSISSFFELQGLLVNDAKKDRPSRFAPLDSRLQLKENDDIIPFSILGFW